VMPHSIKRIIQPLLRFLGRPPGIFTPIIYNGQVMGMLNMVGSKLTNEDIPTMQAFANQIAVALENARLVNQLQSAKNALETAYQKTLEGWVKALELRDNETEGHTLRVANITVRLADFMGVSENEQNYIRQGALLHDIGKMAIPDSILLKPTSLSEVEWIIMQQHPLTAYTWLKDIDYLGSAIYIPHYHHEHWDGSGYPEGLHSEEIPLWARIFTIVDVWDAMLSDRPYRKAITNEDTLSYLNQETGKLFDPRVKEAFFDLLSQKPEVNEIHQILK
jgi:putative nucleotidyltransferase with HDIG domain